MYNGVGPEDHKGAAVKCPGVAAASALCASSSSRSQLAREQQVIEVERATLRKVVVALEGA